MKIVVAVKQVPNVENVAINPVTHDLMRGTDNKMNPFDKYALEAAFELANFYGDEVVAISMGPDQAKEVLAEAIAMGADQGILLSDRKFGGADTLATAYVLTKAIEKIGDVRLVVFGQQAVDADTGQVGPLVASQLAWPQLTYVDKLLDVDAETVTVQRNLGPVTQTMTAKLPVVLTLTEQGKTPRYLSMHRLMTFDENLLLTWNAADLAADEKRMGKAGSPSTVRGIIEPTVTGRQAKKIAGSAVEKLLAVLASEGM